MDPIDFHSIFFSYNVSQLGSINSLITDILQSIFHCVQHKNEINKGLKQLESE